MTSTTPMNERDEARTPPSLFKKLDERFRFTVDIAANENNHLCSNYWSLESRTPMGFLSPYAELYDNDIAWCNPPYSRGNIDRFIKKAHEESLKGAVVVMLLPMDSSTKVFHDYCMKASEWIIFKPRVKFIRPNGEQFKSSPKFGSFACVFDEKNRKDHPVVTSMEWK